MSQMGQPLASGVAAFLLSDIEGSTQRWEDMPGPMRVALARHDQIMRDAVTLSGGHIFKTTGDGFYAAFAAPPEAVAAALAAQRAILAEDFNAVGGLGVRMAVHVGPVDAREGDYFGAGINRAARLLTVAYGGQILISGAAADMVRGLLPLQTSLMDLGLHRLKDFLQSESVFQLVAPGLRAAFPTLRSLDLCVHNLPQQLTPFIGRQHDIEDITQRFQHSRLISLVGPGGAGKTRLAHEVAAMFLKGTLDAVWFVELASVEHAHLVAETVCSTIGVPVAGSLAATDSAIGFLCRKNAFLVLDNCEHQIAATAHLVTALLRSCPSLLVLATSRERLGVQGESPHLVSSLEVPPAAPSLSGADALQYDSVQLFAERASAAVAGFAVTDANAATVAFICRQLDGIPLAIELAVPQLRMLSLVALATRLDYHLLAVRGNRTVLPRHQTLGALFDWSYKLLNDNERTHFERLSVFAGSWSLSGAAQIAAGAAISEDETFDQLSELVNKSLIVAELGHNDARYGFLQMARTFARSKVALSDRRDLQQRLMTFILQLFTEASAAWPTMATQAWLARYEPELENLRACLDWAFGPDGDFSQGVQLVSYCDRIWDELSLFSERERWLAATQSMNRVDVPAQVEARLLLCRLSSSAHGDQTNLQPALQAAKLFHACGDHLGHAEALAKAGAAILEPGSTADAMLYLQDALALLKPLGTTKQLASCLRSLAIAGYFENDFDRARPLLVKSRAVAKTIGDIRGLAAVQIGAAELEFAAGEVTGAIAITKSMLEGDDCNLRQAVLGLTNLASYLLAQDRIGEAEVAARNALSNARALSWRAAAVRAIEHLALVAAIDGRVEIGVKLAGFCAAFYEQGTATREFTELASHRRLAECIAAVPQRQRDLFLAEGAQWLLDEAADIATFSH